MGAVRNISAGPRGAYLDGELVWAEPGQTIEADDYSEEWFAEVDSEAVHSAEITATVELPADPTPAGGDPSNDVIHTQENGFVLTEVGGGWWQITGPGLDEPVKVRGEDAARAKFAELTAQ